MSVDPIKTAEQSGMTWEDAVRWLRDQPNTAQLVADCYYDDPLPEAAQRYWVSHEWQAMRTLLAGYKGTALDVGAGRGIASYALARDGFLVTALEPDSSALVGAGAIRKLIKDTGVSINVVEEFSERLPFPDGAFDVVFARAVLHHTRDLTAACHEFARVLKPGGVMLAVREHVISKRADLPIFLDNHPLHHLYGGENAFLLPEYIHAIRQAGLNTPQVFSPWHSAINFAPYDLRTLQAAIAKNFGPASDLIRLLLRIPGIWCVVRNILAAVDRRPGRLYSFLANKPQ